MEILLRFEKQYHVSQKVLGLRRIEGLEYGKIKCNL